MRTDNKAAVCLSTIWIAFSAILLTDVHGGVGLDWLLPQSHFDGVDEQGHVSYSEKIGELEASNGLQLPIYIVFQSNWMVSSPYLGKGWMLPLLESRIEQMGERWYRLWQPDGWYRDFGVSKTSNTELNGTAGWEAKIDGNTITAWDNRGWKLIFTKNKLSSITTPLNIRIDLVTRNGQVDEVLAGGSSVLRVERDAMSGRVKGFSMRGGKRIALEQQLLPLAQQIGGTNDVKAGKFSLAKVTQVDGKVKTYEYGLDTQNCPTLKIGDRLIVWNSSNQLIMKDGDWTYDIKHDDKNTWANAAIGRTNAMGKYEFWHYDGVKGQEIIQAQDGVQTVRTWFTSGKLAKKVRKFCLIRNGVNTVAFSASYDEQGRMIRSTDQYGVVSFYRYDETGHKTEEIKNGKIVWKRQPDTNGPLH